MSKTLRLGFIMSGGVSLGTFSGAALSEAIKQLIVYGQYPTGETDAQGKAVYTYYDKVEVDVFSGASAGAISLAIMLRILSNHQDKCQLLGHKDYASFRKSLEQRILGQFGAAAYALKENGSEKYEALIAAQAVQDFQEAIWSKGVDIHRLLGTGAYNKDLSNSAGLIDREIVDQLGRDYFRFHTATGQLDHKCLLADRVLFACTLSNLNFTVRKSKQSSNKNDSFLKALNDSSTDRVHSEFRVFDLNYGAINPATVPYYPIPWVQYHQGHPMQVSQEDTHGQTYEKTIGDLSHNDSWKTIISTAIASGAFPFAFEPVVLNRYKHEFGDFWPEELASKEAYPFTYVDGGTFNNEPIREGLKLASYIDNIQNHVDFDRMMIFVDPIVSELETEFRVNVHSQMGIRRNLLSGKAKIAPKSTLMRLAGKAPHMLSAILNEARGAEMSRISSVIERFKKRDKMRDFFKATVGMAMENEAILATRSFVMKELDEIRHQFSLPPNSLQIQHELLRILFEEKDFFEGHLPLDDRMETMDAIQQFVYTPVPDELPNIRYWLVALACVAQDISMKLTGKTADARIVPIAPFDFYKKEHKDYELMHLPGAGISGFAGFASDAASDYEVRYGHYCAYQILKDLNMIGGHEHPMQIPEAFDYKEFTPQVKEEVKRAIVKRVKEIVPKEYKGALPFLEGYIESGIKQFIETNIDNSGPKRFFEFRIQVPSDIYILRGFKDNGQTAKKNHLEPIMMDGKYYLFTQLSYFPNTGKWLGPHCNELQKIFVDRMRFFENSPNLGIDLPKLDNGHEAFLSPNPVFHLDATTQLNIGSYTEIKSIGWELKMDIRPLDQYLW